MKRLRYCVICEKELESGGRVDKKYCGAGCTQAAYRLRHPEKRQSTAGRVRNHGAAGVPIHRPAGGLADSVAQLEVENASLRRELALLKARVAQMERSRISSPTVAERLAGPPKAQHETRSRQTDLAAQEKESQEPAAFATLNVVAMSADERPGGVTSPASNRPQPALPRAPFPWEVPNPDEPGGWRPYWQKSEDTIRWLEKEGRNALRAIPTQIYNRGDRLKAREMREWIESRPVFIDELAEELAGRVVCTRRSERRSKQQKDHLSILALRDSVEYLRKRKPDVAMQFDQYYPSRADMYEWMAREFVDAIDGCYFADQ